MKSVPSHASGPVAVRARAALWVGLIYHCNQRITDSREKACDVTVPSKRR